MAAKIVELSLAFSKEINDQLLLLILSDPFTGDIIKTGIVERSILDYANIPYDQIITGVYPKQDATYPSSLVIHDNYLQFICRNYDAGNRVIDSYQVRINWTQNNDITIGAYKNSIVHAKIERSLAWSFTNGIPNLYGYFRIEKSDQGFLLEDINGNLIIYKHTDIYPYKSYLNQVITDIGIQLVLFNNNYEESGIYLNKNSINSYQLKDGEQYNFQGQLLTRVPVSEGQIDTTAEYLIKNNASGFIATMSNRNIIVPRNPKLCHFLRNGNSPTGYDCRLQQVDIDQFTDLTKPNLIELYPYFGIKSFAHRSYEIYYDTTNGFWRDHVYTEEIIDDY